MFANLSVTRGRLDTMFKGKKSTCFKKRRTCVGKVALSLDVLVESKCKECSVRPELEVTNCAHVTCDESRDEYLGRPQLRARMLRTLLWLLSRRLLLLLRL